MPQPAWLYRVMIASPGDVSEEREAARDEIYEWNVHHGRLNSTVLLPVLWETHSYPTYGERPQASVNKQLLPHSDILIAIFWSRLGTPTGEEESGTVEEIKRFAASGKHVSIYFSDKQLSPSSVSADELRRVHDFKARIKGLGLYWEFKDTAHFKELLRRHIPMILNQVHQSRLPPGVGLRRRTELQTLATWEPSRGASDILMIGLNLNIVLRQKGFFRRKLSEGGTVRLVVIDPDDNSLLHTVSRGVIEQQHFGPDVHAAIETLGDIRRSLPDDALGRLHLRVIDYVPTSSFTVIDGNTDHGVITVELAPNRIDVPSRPHFLLTTSDVPWFELFLVNCQTIFDGATVWRWERGNGAAP